MAKIISLAASENAARGCLEVSVLLDEGTVVTLFEGDTFIPLDDFEKMRAEYRDANDQTLRELQAEIGTLKQEIASRGDAPKALLHDEHQDVPVPRTLDKLSPLDALSQHKPLDEPQPMRPEDDPDAPARPPMADQPSRGLDQAIAEAKTAADQAVDADVKAAFEAGTKRGKKNKNKNIETTG